MTMDCTEFLARYSDYDDSLLSAAELERFQAHLSRCGPCSRYDRVLRKGRMLARQRSPLQGTAEFMPRLHRRLWQDRTQRRRPAPPALGGVAIALAAVTVILTAFWVITLLGQEQGPGAVGDAAFTLAESTAREAVPAVSYGAGWRILPVADAAPAREWGAQRVDPGAPVAYSPLVTGPPAYRVPATHPSSATISTRHSFD
jgi:predicted anti-sigma-YlaC factor YlaD